MKFLGSLFKKDKQPEAAHLDRVHLIVHPGDGLRNDNVEAENRLLQAIAARASSLETKNEIAVILLQMNADEWQKVRQPDYAGKERVLASAILRIESAIPKNMIVIPGAPSVTFPSINPALEKIRAKIGESGFSIDEHTQLLSYGEQLIKCVPISTHAFVDHFGLKTKPTIDVNYTDALIDAHPVAWQRNGTRLGLEQLLNSNAFKYIPLGESEKN